MFDDPADTTFESNYFAFLATSGEAEMLVELRLKDESNPEVRIVLGSAKTVVRGAVLGFLQAFYPSEHHTLDSINLGYVDPEAEPDGYYEEHMVIEVTRI